MRGLRVLAAVAPDNTPHGYDLTFAVPIVLFAVVAVALYLLLSRPHRRVPARRGVLPARPLAPPDPDAARAAAVAGGLSVAAGGGAAESHLEAAGHVYGAGTADGGDAEAADAEAADAEAGDAGTGDAGTLGGAGPGADAGDSAEAGSGPPDGDGPDPAGRAEDGQ
jgi:hypothetical protein